MVDLSAIRREYTKGGLRRSELPEQPLALFEQWMAQARDAQLSDPTAMVVATAGADGQPSQRIVLLKRFDQQGFVFYTNLGSRKAREIAENDKVSLLFPWHPIERQVIITGRAQKLSAAEAMRYFVSRPKESQIAAWVSRQSSKVSARQLLEAKYQELKQQFAKGDIPLPTFWGGYRVHVESIEFWQGGEHRLHDRFIYTREQGEQWAIERLAP